MRVLLDANLFSSFLLKPKADTASTHLVRAAIRGEFRLLLPQHLLDEFVSRASGKPYLASRIRREDLRELVQILEQVGEPISRITQPIPALTRDAKDDYLIAYALVGRADCLVTGDADLLDLGQIDRLKISTAKDFLAVLAP